MASEPSGIEPVQLSIKGESESLFDKQEYSPFIKMKEKRIRRESAREMLSKQKDNKSKDALNKEKNINQSKDKDKIKFIYANGISPLVFNNSPQSIRESNESIIGKLQQHHFTPFHSQSFNLFSGIKLETNHKQPIDNNTDSKKQMETTLKPAASIPSFRSNSKESLHTSITYFEYMSKMAQLKLKNQQKLEQLRTLKQRKSKLKLKQTQIEQRRQKLASMKQDNQSIASTRQGLQAEYALLKKERHSLQQQYKHQVSMKKSSYQEQISKDISLISSQHMHVQQLLNQISQTQRFILQSKQQAHPEVREALQQFRSMEDKIVVGMSRYKANEGVEHLWQVMDVELTQLMHT